MADQPDHAHDLTDDTEEQARQQFTSQFRQPPPRKKNTVEAGEKRSRPGRPPGSKNKPKSVDTQARGCNGLPGWACGVINVAACATRPNILGGAILLCQSSQQRAILFIHARSGYGTILLWQYLCLAEPWSAPRPAAHTPHPSNTPP